MKTIIHKANERGIANFGWLDSKHSFSFGHFYDPSKMGFGLLRVLNDDIVQGGMGFGEHPHDNMEIVSIPLSGALAHRDSTGTDAVIRAGEVQIMSAGTGIRHSEFNHSKTDLVNFLQIWIFPKQRNIAPRYDQKMFDVSERDNKLQVVVSPDAADNAVWINQDAWFSLTNLSAQSQLEYTSKKEGNGLYLFVLKGSVKVGEQLLDVKDAMGITEYQNCIIEAESDAELLLIDVPMG